MFVAGIQIAVSRSVTLRASLIIGLSVLSAGNTAAIRHDNA